jgi:hypothetical protein
MGPDRAASAVSPVLFSLPGQLYDSRRPDSRARPCPPALGLLEIGKAAEGRPEFPATPYPEGYASIIRKQDISRRGFLATTAAAAAGIVNSVYAKDKPKGRWYRFLLRVLLVLVTVCAMSCSWIAIRWRQARQRREAVEAIEKLGGKAYTDVLFEIPYLDSLVGEELFGSVCKVDFRNTQATDEDLKSIGMFRHLRILSIDATGVADAGLENLAGLDELQDLPLIKSL